jgi:hypothetical protein
MPGRNSTRGSRSVKGTASPTPVERGAVILVDHSAEDLPALYQRVQRNDGRLVMIGWPLLTGLMRPMLVIVPNIGLRHRPQAGLVVDQHPVGALGPDGRTQRSA